MKKALKRLHIWWLQNSIGALEGRIEWHKVNAEYEKVAIRTYETRLIQLRMRLAQITPANELLQEALRGTRVRI